MSHESMPAALRLTEGLGPCAEVPVHPRSGRLWANVRPVGAQTPVPNYPLDALYDQAALEAAVAAERERCAKLVTAPRDDECEAVIACLGDDAALLRNDNLDCEIAANMDTAAGMMEKLREFRHEAVRALQAVLAVADRDTVEFDMARASIAKATGCAA